MKNLALYCGVKVFFHLFIYECVGNGHFLISGFSCLFNFQGTSGLAMSRSIGDWDAGSVGVIPDPLVDVLDIQEVKTKVLEHLNSAEGGFEACLGGMEAMEIDPASGDIQTKNKQCIEYSEKDIKVFAFSATDGLLDYVPSNIIAKHVARGLYNTGINDEDDDSNDASRIPKTTHPLTSCEDLICAAAQGWQDDKGGRYRDDIAIAVADLESLEE